MTMTTVDRTQHEAELAAYVGDYIPHASKLLGIRGIAELFTKDVDILSDFGNAIGDGVENTLANFGNAIGDRINSYTYKPRHATKPQHEAASGLQQWIHEHPIIDPSQTPTVNLEKLPAVEEVVRHIIDIISPELDPSGHEESTTALAKKVGEKTLHALHIHSTNADQPTEKPALT